MIIEGRIHLELFRIKQFSNPGAGAMVLESSRRLTDRWVMDLEIRGTFNTSPKNLLHQVRKDEFIQFGLSWYL